MPVMFIPGTRAHAATSTSTSACGAHRAALPMPAASTAWAGTPASATGATQVLHCTEAVSLLHFGCLCMLVCMVGLHVDSCGSTIPYYKSSGALVRL